MPASLGRLLACTHPAAQLAGLVGLAAAALYLLAAALLHKRHHWAIPVACLALLIGAAWLGSLRYSPLGFGSERRPLLNDFEIKRLNRAPVRVTTGAVLSVVAGSPVQIYPQILPGPVDCLWAASAGGALDDPHSCDTVYVAAAGRPSETLRVRLRSACGLEPAVAQIKISILP